MLQRHVDWVMGLTFSHHVPNHHDNKYEKKKKRIAKKQYNKQNEVDKLRQITRNKKKNTVYKTISDDILKVGENRN